ncbi:uncharacterized protein [Rutidosis leptorrhynchoides]|uniref:uncharacterized protein n=1 Tax=Rutidosis leptorrhynchoides TaxID=125765 RepID=UPI003A9952AC
MEHYKSRNNDFFYFTNPHDDASQLDDTDYDDSQFHDSFDDDERSCDFNFHTCRPQNITQSPSSNFQTSGVMNLNDSVTTSSVNEFRGFDIIQLDDRMKGVFDKVNRTIEGIGVRISRLEDETCRIDKRVEDVKETEERYHGMKHSKLQKMQILLQEVQNGVLFLRDRHEIAETKLQVAKLQVLMKDKPTPAQTNPQHQQQPSTASQSSCYVPFYPFSNQSNVTLSPGVYHHHPAFPQAPEVNVQQHVIPLNQQFQTPNTSSYRLPQSIHVESSRNYKSEFHAKYMPESDSFPGLYTPGGPPSSYEFSNLKPDEFYLHTLEESSRNSYNHTPVIQSLPHALPTAINLEDESSSEENVNAITADNIIDNVTAMGFRRDLVRACVTELTVNGSPVDLNAVLDSIMKWK